VNRRLQSGITLVIALVMLIVLSLLVVSAIRFGNINLKITGNVQAETEAIAAAQFAIEKTIKDMIIAPNMSSVAAQPDLAVSTGGREYSVNVIKPVCLFTRNVSNTELDPAIEGDRPCFEGNDAERLITSGGILTTTPTACKNQQWDVQASVDDNSSGAKTTILQGVATRVGAEVQCP
jgi:hypothetical protein